MEHADYFESYTEGEDLTGRWLYDLDKETMHKVLSHDGPRVVIDGIRGGLVHIDTIKQRLHLMRKDNCEVCKGEKGGVRGNENVIDGVVTCDYCHAEQLRSK
jgi:hypothetical protein